MNKTLLIIIVVLLVVGGGWVLLQGSTTTVPTPTTIETETPAVDVTEKIEAKESPGEAMTDKEVAITIQNFAFSPKTVTVKKGTKVTWTNQDVASHTVTSDTGTELNSELLGKGESFSHVFNEAGTFAYHCTPHPNMQATVVVE